MIQHKKPIHV